MYKIVTDEKLRVGEYLSVELVDDNVVFFKEGRRLDVKTAVNPQIFKNRKLKAVVREKTKTGYNVSIVRFADLHRHSGYSLLDGASKTKDLAELTEYAGALTDHGNMFGFLEYYKAMKKEGKQPILGFEAYAETIEGEKKGNHLVLLAKNEVGYKNLIKLTSLAFENFYRYPHVSYKMLEEHSEGLIVLSGCLGGEIPRAINKGDYEKAKKIAQEFKKIFKDNFYIEIQRHNIGEEEERVNKGLIQLSKEMNIKLVATTDSHYSRVEDREFHEMLLALQTGRTMSDSDRIQFGGDGYHIHTPDEMDIKFKDLPEALDNTLEIAEKCSEFQLNLGEIYLPKFNVPEGHTEESYFEELVYEGFKDRFGDKEEYNSEIYKNRLKYEIGIIKEMGYCSYFLIVWDFINFAKTNDIMVGPGRGSAAGSLVSYCLHITDLDPIPYGLLFERFLNPERVSMPDIDIDFCFERREEVIEYVKNKYGEEAVSGIVTFGTFAARGAVRDIARVNNYPYHVGDRIAKAIPLKPGMTIKDALDENPELKNMYETEEVTRMILDTAMKVEGLPRHSSRHACGVVISDGPVENYLPEFLAGEGNNKERTSQVTMTEVEELGLLKMDFLGLKTMTVIGKTIESINKNTNNNIRYLDIPHNDPYVYRDISKGYSHGVFQLESPGMRSLMIELFFDVDSKIKELEKKYKVKGFNNPQGKGDKEAFISEMKGFGQELFERLIAGVSLYRPGPMDYLPNYLEGMRNPENIIYLTPELEPILEATYGTIVYQEQVMQIVQSLAGYSLGRADLVRRAMGKKKDEIMKEEKDYFINGKLNEDGTIDVPGCVRNGISKEIAEEIWEQMADFSKYAFNKSHAAVYALLGAITAWLKYYYPIDFMAETMNVFINDSGKLKLYLSVTNDMGIKILPPNVNSSEELFARDGNDIRFGLRGIRNMGKTSKLIIEERNKRGKFKGYQDFAVRMAKYQRIDKRVLDGAIYSGALDEFEGTRKGKLEVLSLILSEASEEKRAHETGQIAIFDIMPEASHLKEVSIPNIEEFDKRYKLEKEKEFAGFYVTEHPLDDYIPYFKHEDITEIGYLTIDTRDDAEEDIELNKEMKDDLDGKRIKVAGIINDRKTFFTKKDAKPLYVFQVEGKTGEIKAVMFSDKIEKIGERVQEGNVVIVDGVLKNNDFGLQLIVNDITDISTLKNKKSPKALAIKAIDKKQLVKLNEILNRDKDGYIPVYVTIEGKKLKAEKMLNYNDATSRLLENTFGENYRFVY